MQVTEQRAAKQPEASSSVSDAALQAMQTDLQHQACIPPDPVCVAHKCDCQLLAYRIRPGAPSMHLLEWNGLENCKALLGEETMATLEWLTSSGKCRGNGKLSWALSWRPCTSASRLRRPPALPAPTRCASLCRRRRRTRLPWRLSWLRGPPYIRCISARVAPEA